jgi:hypothetical protein
LISAVKLPFCRQDCAAGPKTNEKIEKIQYFTLLLCVMFVVGAQRAIDADGIWMQPRSRVAASGQPWSCGTGPLVIGGLVETATL